MLEKALDPIEEILASAATEAGIGILRMADAEFFGIGEDMAEAAGGISADLDLVAKDGFQVLCGNLVHRIKLFLRAVPHLVFGIVASVIRLVPDLPILNTVFVAVCPALVIVPDNMLADARPLRIVLRRKDAIGLDIVVILDGFAEAEDRGAICFHQGRNENIREGEIIGCGIGFVRMKITEHVMDIHEAIATVNAANVMQTGIGDRGLREIMEKHIAHAEHRGLTNRVHSADLANGIIKVKPELHTKNSLFCDGITECAERGDSRKEIRNIISGICAALQTDEGIANRRARKLDADLVFTNGM